MNETRELAMKATVTGTSLDGEKDKDVTVEVEEGVATVRIGKEGVHLDRHTLPALVQAAQAAFMEVS